MASSSDDLLEQISMIKHIVVELQSNMHIPELRRITQLLKQINQVISKHIGLLYIKKT